jgi:hypothetical protein
MQRFSSLTIRQKTIFFVVLCVLSLGLACLSTYAAWYALSGWNNNRRAEQEQSKWLERSRLVEEDLAKLSVAGAQTKGLSRSQVESAVEKVANQIGVEYTLMLTSGEKSRLGQLVVTRLRVVFEAIALTQFIDFCDGVEALDDGLAISEIRIKAQDNELLSAHCVISILGTE